MLRRADSNSGVVIAMIGFAGEKDDAAVTALRKVRSAALHAIVCAA